MAFDFKFDPKGGSKMKSLITAKHFFYEISPENKSVKTFWLNKKKRNIQDNSSAHL